LYLRAQDISGMGKNSFTTESTEFTEKMKKKKSTCSP
jgi:hypothetical protein